MRNPFKHPAHASPDRKQYWTGAWDTKVEAEVPRQAEGSLVFRCPLPSELRLIPLADLVGAARDAPAWIGESSAVLGEAAQRAGTALAGAIAPRENPTDVLATLTVAFSEQVRDPRIDIHQPGPDEKVKQHVLKMSDNCTLVQRIMPFQPAPEAELRAILVQEYLWAMSYGGLVMAFSTTHDGMFGDYGNDLFIPCAQRSELVEAGTVG